MKYYIGIDNGATGSITILTQSGALIHSAPTPVNKELSYTKVKQEVTRVNHVALYDLLYDRLDKNRALKIALVERPLVNPRMFKATLSGIRALEATLIVLESLAIPYQYIDSKEWQKALLPSGCKDSAELKKAAIDVARRLYPKTHRDVADSVLIAEYARRKKL